MNKVSPKYRKRLNDGQLEVLGLLYKFRFGSSELIAKHFGKKLRADVYRRVRILEEQGLIGKRYEPAYKLLGKPAAYYLTAKGARELQSHRPDKIINIKSVYTLKRLSESFVTYYLSIFEIHCQLKAKYGDSLKFFTRVQLTHYDYFEDFVPAVYIRLERDGTEKDCFLEYLQSSKPLLAAIQRLKQYVSYADSGDWEAETESDFPTVLLVCDRQSLQNRLLKRAAFVLDEADDDLKCFVTAHTNLLTAAWHDMAEPDETLPLSPI